MAPARIEPAVRHSKHRGRKRGHAADGLCQRNDAFVESILADLPGEIAVVSGVWHTLSQRSQTAIGGCHRPWLAHQPDDIGRVHVEGNQAGGSLPSGVPSPGRPAASSVPRRRSRASCLRSTGPVHTAGIGGGRRLHGGPGSRQPHFGCAGPSVVGSLILLINSSRPPT